MDRSYLVVVISNQAGISFVADKKAPKAFQSRLAAFKSKALAVFTQLDIPIAIYAATEKDCYRKPRIGMWNEMLDDFDLTNVNLKDSLFVGDAAGRVAGHGKSKDFSCSDRYVLVVLCTQLED